MRFPQKRNVLLLLVLLALFPLKGVSLGATSTAREEQRMADRAERFIQEGHLIDGIQTLELFTSTYPRSPILSDVFMRLGEVLLQQGDLKKAEEAYLTFLKKFPTERRVNDARSSLSQTYLRMENVEEALAVWEGVPEPEMLALPIYNRAIEIYTKREDYHNVLRVLTRKRALISDPTERAATEEAIVALLQNRISEKNLQALVTEFAPHYPADEVLIRLIRLYDTQELYHREEKEIKRFLSLFPGHTHSEQIQEDLKTLRTKLKKYRHLIAVILPLSGKLSSFGESALQGVQLALKQFKEELPGAQVTLVVRDDDDPSKEGQKALEEWLNDYKPLGIIGPLLSKDVDRVAPLAKKGGWVLISPGASSPSLALLGDTVFRNAATPTSQCSALTEYATQTRDLTRFAILYPDNKSGEKWVSCLKQGISLRQGSVVAAQSYRPHASDFNGPIKQLKAIHKNEGREVPGFDALFLPGEAREVGLIIPQLAFHDLRHIVLLGTMTWNDPGFLRLVGPYAEGAIFTDGFFAKSADPLVQTFVQQYREDFQQEPDIFAAQSYDAAQLILESMKKGALTRSEVKDAVAVTHDFPGVSGYIYEMRDGEAIKKPFFIQVKKGKLVQID